MLKSLATQSRLPDEVIVVDDSDEQFREETEQVVRDASLDVRLLTKSTPGLPASRNLAADAAEGEVILYLDDDVVLDRRYVAALLSAFSDERAVGAGGVIINSPLPAAPLLKELIGVTGRPNGRVLRSGWSTALPRSDAPTQFLSGCNMAYLTAIVREERFDESFFEGYGLGEDLEFSYRLHRHRGSLRIVGSARLWHLSKAKVYGRPRGWLEVVKNPKVAGPRFSRPRFAVAALALAASNIVKGDPARGAGNLQGILWVLRGGGTSSLLAAARRHAPPRM